MHYTIGSIGGGGGGGGRLRTFLHGYFKFKELFFKSALGKSQCVRLDDSFSSCYTPNNVGRGEKNDLFLFLLHECTRLPPKHSPASFCCEILFSSNFKHYAVHNMLRPESGGTLAWFVSL